MGSIRLFYEPVELSTMSKIDEVFQIFEDGKTHGVGEITKKVSLPEPKVRKVLDFLAEFGFIEYDGKGAKASPAGIGILSREKSSKFPVFF
ncbi:hypothetical protein ES703_66476 [subsurface metagenome]